MNRYRVSFYKNLLNSDGHNFKCLQREIEVRSEGPSQALFSAERLVDNERLGADSVEVVRLNANHPGLDHGADHGCTPCKHTWSRVA